MVRFEVKNKISSQDTFANKHKHPTEHSEENENITEGINGICGIQKDI